MVFFIDAEIVIDCLHLIRFVESFLAKLIVLPPQLVVFEDFVGAIDAHELFTRLGIVLRCGEGNKTGEVNHT